MYESAVLIFPHQLFQPHPASLPNRLHVLLEDPLFFGDLHHPLRFHKQKLMLHRASMQHYARRVLAGLPQLYLEYSHLRDTLDSAYAQLVALGVREVHIVDPVDYLVERRVRRYCARYGLRLVWHESPNFLTPITWIEAFYDGHSKRYHQTDFYIAQRKRLGLLLTHEGKPLGGRWTYDSENRQKLPAGLTLPAAPSAHDDEYIREARRYVETHFPHHPGSTEAFIYPITQAQASAALARFLEERLAQFGPYQDAISPRNPFLFHSLLSAPLNIGLLSPQQIVQAALEHFEAEPQTPLASLEGFLRQIVGWREFIRAVYVRAGVEQRRRNFFGGHRALSARWYDGSLGILPVDDVIHKLNRYAYSHHIGRLMLAGNLMALCEIHPDQVYTWFMEMHIDAYDWVMVPNVYGMSQHADGGLMTTKPYLSSSNYVRKMSDYKPGPWAEIWDSLYWCFIAKHRAFFDANPRLRTMTSHLDRMEEAGVRAHQQRAEDFLRGL